VGREWVCTKTLLEGVLRENIGLFGGQPPKKSPDHPPVAKVRLAETKLLAGIKEIQPALHDFVVSSSSSSRAKFLLLLLLSP
jgi:hypothetical protein